MKEPMIEQWIYDFVKAICPEAPELYMSMFDEKVAITDATRIINELTAENEKLKRENTKASKVKGFLKSCCLCGEIPTDETIAKIYEEAK